MAECDVCGSPLGSGAPAGTWQSHVSDFNDPHRTMELVARELPALSVGSAPPSSTDGAKARDWFVDLMAGTLWVCLPAQGGGLEWTAVADRSPAAQDLSGYATRAMLADYATVASLSGYLRPSDLSGYNFITQSALAAALAPYATSASVASAIASSGFISQAAADARYVLAGQSAETNYVTQSQLSAALASYLTSASAAQTYLTSAAADGPTGFVRKGASLPYVTPAQLTSALSGYALTADLSGFVTQTAADARYVQAGTGTGAAVTVGAMNSALASYLRIADAAATLSLSSYLTVSAADAPAGFLRKTDFATAASAAGLVTSSALTSRLASYVTQQDVASAVEAQVASATADFATSEDLADLAASIAIEQGNGTALAVLELDGGYYRPVARSNNLVVLTGSTSSIPVLVPVRSAGASRDFILTVAFGSGTSLWSGTSFAVVPSTRQSETVQCRFFAADGGTLSVDASLFDLDNQMVVFGFTEVADGKFLVTRKVVTDLASAPGV